MAKHLRAKFRLHHLAETASQEELVYEVRRNSQLYSIGGVIIQLPLPPKFNRQEILANLTPTKDVDNLTGKASVPSPVVAVVEDILREVDWQLTDKVVAVVGQGFLVGQPIIGWLTRNNINFKVADINTRDLKSFLAEVDLVISGVGQNNLIKADWLKPGRR